MITKRKIRILPLLSLILVLVLVFAPYAYCADGAPRVIDEAGLLTVDDIYELEADLEVVETDYGLDAVILTVEGTDGMDIQEFADLYYEENSYGIGDERDGMILAVDMDSRQWSISTTGKGVQVLTEAALDIMEQQIVEMMSEGDFYNAFMYGYAENIRFFADYYEINGTPYDYGTAEDYGSYEYTYEDGTYAAPAGRSLLQTAGMTLPPALIVGFLVSFIMAINEKRKLTSVHFEKEADAYIRPGSLVITADRARYMYSNVVVTVKPDTNQHNGPSSNAGSHVHVSSGRMSHGGRSGSF